MPELSTANDNAAPAQWAPIDLALGKAGMWKCTACGRVIELPYRVEYCPYAYCPYCGNAVLKVPVQ